MIRQAPHIAPTRAEILPKGCSNRISVICPARKGRSKTDANADATAKPAAAEVPAAEQAEQMQQQEEPPIVRSSRGRRGTRQVAAVGAVDVLAPIRGKLVVTDPATG